MSITNEDCHQDEYDTLYKNAIIQIEKAKNNIEVIKEKVILTTYWNLGEMLIEMGDISETALKEIRDCINEQIKNDQLFRHEPTNTYWLKLAKLWVMEHSKYEKTIMLSGSVTWLQWALILEIINSAPQRYWLVCKTIKQGWDLAALLRAAQALPKEYLNH